MFFIIADDHTLFADTLIILLQRSFGEDTQVQHAEDIQGVFDIMKDAPAPDLVFLDYRMPGMGDLQGLKELRQAYPTVKFALMSGHAEDDDIEQALNIGVKAYFPKTMSKTALISSIKLVLQGYKFAPLAHGEVDIKYYPSHNDDAEHAADNDSPLSDKKMEIQGKIELLSKRERDILGCLLRGYSNQQIAERFDLQVSTVKIHVRNVCQKLDVKNRTQAALMAQSVDFPVKMAG